MQRGRLYHDVFSAKWPLSRIPIDVVVEFAAGGTGYVNSLRWQTGLEAMGELAHILVVRHVLQGDQIVHRLHEHRVLIGRRLSGQQVMNASNPCRSRLTGLRCLRKAATWLASIHRLG